MIFKTTDAVAAVFQQQFLTDLEKLEKRYARTSTLNYNTKNLHQIASVRHTL